MSSPRAHLTSLIARNSPSIAAAVNEPVVRFMVEARAFCEDDLDMFLVLMVVIQRANLHPEFRELDPEAVASGAVQALPTFDLNIQSIADSTRIPKETVRRKVARLIELGWVERTGRCLRYTPEGYRAVGPARDAVIRMMVRITGVVELIEQSEMASAS